MKQKIMYVGIREQFSTKLTIVVDVVDNNELKVAVAVCNTEKDKFIKAIGRKIATGRLNKEGAYLVTKFTGRSENDIQRLFDEELDEGVRNAFLGYGYANKKFYVVDKKLMAFAS